MSSGVLFSVAYLAKNAKKAFVFCPKSVFFFVKLSGVIKYDRVMAPGTIPYGKS